MIWCPEWWRQNAWKCGVVMALVDVVAADDDDDVERWSEAAAAASFVKLVRRTLHA